MSRAIDIDSLRVVRGGNTILHDISLRIPEGEITGLLGPSGCGKTTLMRAIVGVQIVALGSVRVLDEPAGTASLRSRVGYVTQAPSVYGDLSVRENLRYFASVLGVGPERVEQVVDLMGLRERVDVVARSLSGGQRSRVSLGTALLNEPALLVLDEPTVGLDPVLRDELWRTFRDLAERGTTLLVSSHVMDEAAECDRLLLMREGRILSSETPDELRERTGEQDMGRAFLRVIQVADRAEKEGVA